MRAFQAALIAAAAITVSPSAASAAEDVVVVYDASASIWGPIDGVEIAREVMADLVGGWSDETNLDLEALDLVITGASFAVSWSASVHPQDYVTIVSAGADEGTYTNFQRVRDDTENTLIAPAAPAAVQEAQSLAGDPMIAQAESLVRDLYDVNHRAEQGAGPDPLQGPEAGNYFTSDIVALLRSGGIGAHPLYGAQDFDGRITRIAPDPDQPVLRGMITINVDFTNFGQPQRAVHYLRADTTMSGAPLRIFRVEHDGWSYP